MMNAEIGHKFEPAVGALLRASRLRCGEDLRDVAALLRIRHVYLEAIEEGRYEDLPGVTYAVGFVRTYAEHLGLDAEEVVRRFKAESENLERRTELVFPSPIAERGTPGAAIIFIGVLVAALAYGAWYIGTSEDSVFDGLVTPLPDRLAALLPGDAEQPAQPDQGPSTAEAAPQTDFSAPQTAPAETGSLGSPPPQQADAAEEVQPEAVADEAAQPETPVATAPTAPVAETGAAPSVIVPQTPAPGTDQGTVTSPVEREAPVAAPKPVPPTTSQTGAQTPSLAGTPAPDVAAVPEIPAAAPAAAEQPQSPEAPAESQAAEIAVPVRTSEPVPPAADIPQPSEPVQEPATVAAPPQLSETPAPVPAAPAATEPAPQVPAAGQAEPASANPPQPAEVPVAAPSTSGDLDEQTAAVPPAPADVPVAPGGGSTEAAAEQVAAVPEAPPAPAMSEIPAATADAGGARIEVRALSDSWIQIRDGVARRLLVTRLLRAGDTYVVPDQPGLTLLTGNAGALEILVDGEAVKPIGEEGAVRRNVVLDAGRLLAGTAVVD